MTYETPSAPSKKQTARSNTRKRKQQLDAVDSALLSQIEKCSGNEDGDEASSFGQHVAFCLRRLSDRQRALACIEIDKALFNIEFPDDLY